MSNSFKDRKTLEERLRLSKAVLEKYPGRVPVICEKHPSSTLPDLKKNKYLIPPELSLGNFIYTIRKNIKINAYQSIFIFVNHKIFPSSMLLSLLYQSEKDEDNFLYINYMTENTFGEIK